jgi:CRISPR/Cas system-associated exonuclease Cas4 (RecB family)
MTLPTDFQFSQSSLQDYVDCPRRFYLRYARRLAWPAIEAEPPLENERYLHKGEAFHRLVHQHVLGLPSERLSSTITDEELRLWWHIYLQTGPAGLPAARYPEVILSAPVSGHRLVAKYDLTAIDPRQRVVIVEWKTFRKRPQREWLSLRLQTKVYPYLLVRAGSHLNSEQSLQPQQVEMRYWFANFPAQPERFSYDAAQYEADEVYLASLIDKIESLGEEGFRLTADQRRCRYCPYRSLCERGVQAGAFDEAEDELEWADDLDIIPDFEQIAEIEY